MVEQEKQTSPETEPKKKPRRSFFGGQSTKDIAGKVKDVIAETRRSAQQRRIARKFSKKASTPFVMTDIGTKPLSQLQANIIQRERVLRVIRNTPPMERAKVLNKLSNFKRQVENIRSDITTVKKPSGLIPFQNSPVQQAQQRFKDKIREGISGKTNTQSGDKTNKLNVLPSRIRAPTRLV